MSKKLELSCKKNVNVIIIDSHPENDSRIRRHLRFLGSNGFNVFHINYKLDEKPLCEEFFEHECIKSFRIKIIKKSSNKIFSLWAVLKFFTHKIAYLTLSALEFMELDLSLPIIIHIHDPFLLPLAANLKKLKLKNAKLVYDRHEVYEQYPRTMGFNIYTFFEEIAKSAVSGVVVVSQHHEASVNKIFTNCEIGVVPNYPLLTDYNLIEINNKITNLDPPIKLIYIGSLNRCFDRDIDLLLKISKDILDNFSDVKIMIGGRGADNDLIKQFLSYEANYPKNFIYLGEVSQDEVKKFNQEAHLGFFLIKPNSTYWVKSSPNKVYEYILCGAVPVIRADIDNFMDINKSALIFNRYDDDNLILDSVRNLLRDRRKLKELMKSCQEKGVNLTWESAAINYIYLYDKLIKEQSIPPIQP